jgi:hypothetical protein
MTQHNEPLAASAAPTGALAKRVTVPLSGTLAPTGEVIQGTRVLAIQNALVAVVSAIFASGENGRVQDAYSLFATLSGNWYVALTTKPLLKNSAVIASAPCVGYATAALLSAAFLANQKAHT